ncbi:hypothetical protein DN068_10710 [Taibaiella soli]|uniref:Uncharacterized protein n=1 Tax=Taibaiella soli TaxID=1649169 RepID=A0A2W2ABT4_9BACT|nr:hypothetical protein DN068_10710 [Taibaiella soli]
MIWVMVRVCIAIPRVLIVFPVFPVVVSVTFVHMSVRTRTKADKDHSRQAKKGDCFFHMPYGLKIVLGLKNNDKIAENIIFRSLICLLSG